MKKGFWGYKVSEANVVINALREENESLNATITTLKTQVKNNVPNNSAKANLLESDLKKNEENLKKIIEEKNTLIFQITSLSLESEVLKQQNAELITQIEQFPKQNEDLVRQISEFQKQLLELAAQDDEAASCVVEAPQSQPDTEKTYQGALEQALNDTKEELYSVREELAVSTSDLENAKSKLTLLANNYENEKAQVSASTREYEGMKEELHRTKAALESVIGELNDEKAMIEQKELEADQAQVELYALKVQLEKAFAKNYEQADKLAAIGAYAEDYRSLKEKLVFTCASLNEKTIGLERAKAEIVQLNDMLTSAKITIGEQAKLITTGKKQLANLNQATEISYQAYYDMSKMRNEVVEYMHEQMKEYYQLVNDNSVKLRLAFEQRQLEYRQMIREFFAKASEFRANLSNIDNEYSNMTDYNLNIDKISNRMNEIMDHFIEETSANLKKKGEDLKPEEELHHHESSSNSNTPEGINKPLVFKFPS